MKKHLIFFCLAFLSLLYVLVDTYKLKTISYDKIPAVGVALDEFEFAWMGVSLTSMGMPVSWTTNLNSYKKNYIKAHLTGFSLSVDDFSPSFDNIREFPKPVVAVVEHDYGKGPFHLDLVQPFFDNPPLAGLVYSMNIPKSTSSLLDVTSEQFRYPARFIALLTAILLFLLGYMWYGPVVGLLSAVIYSVFPSAVFSSRLAVAENVITPLFLLSVLFVTLGKKYPRFWVFAIGGVFAGLATLTKFSGFGVVLAGVLLILHWRLQRKYIVYFIIPVLFFFSAYILYGLYLSPELFFRVILSQAGRASWGSIGFLNNLARLGFDGFPLDGWWAGGFFVFLYFLMCKKHFSILITSFSYLVTLLFLGGGTYAWYLFPFAAFFSIGYSILISEILIRPSTVPILLLFIFPIFSSLYWGMVTISPDKDFSILFRLMLLGGLVVYLFRKRLQKIQIKWRPVWILFVIVILVRLYVLTYRSDLYLLTKWNSLTSPLVFR